MRLEGRSQVEIILSVVSPWKVVQHNTSLYHVARLPTSACASMQAP